MEENKNIKKGEHLNEADIERLQLLQRAHERRGKQLTISSNTGNLEEIDELREIIGKQFDNPEEKYKIYYIGILPKQ